MRKRLITATIFSIALILVCAYASSSDKEKQKIARMEEIMRTLPDSIFSDVKMEDLIDDETYLKLAHDGWSAREISAIMETAVKDKKKARLKAGYGFYAKQWRPTFGRALGDDPLYQFMDTTISEATIANIIEVVGENDYNAFWPKEPYDPSLRRQPGYVRTPGYFRPVEFKPSSGRIHWIVVNPNDPNADSLYVVADGCGIFRTCDRGKTWRCITDNIPDRANRSQSPGYAIPVDPDDWNHVFAFMQNSSVYETKDGGETWRRIAGATHKTFKRGYCFRDARGKLKFIGADMNSSDRMKNSLWISEDTCKTWVKVTVDDRFTHINSNTGSTGFWFQQMAFDPNDRDRIYLPGSTSILYFDNGATKDSQGKYQLKQLEFYIYGVDKNHPREGGNKVTKFPLDGNGAGHLEIDPADPNKMWFACGRTQNTTTALYYTEDRGQSWITLHEPSYRYVENGDTVAIGSGSLFGNENANTWLGGFGLDFRNRDAQERPVNFYGCSMSSAISTDGGHNFKEFAWGTRIKSYQADNKLYYVSASRHNADNHCIASHPSGFVFRGADGGMFMYDPDHTKNEGTWINIAGNMGEMLFYNVRTNEFGDQAIIGNTQDIDVQTYRYGRWGNWLGYEGCEASLNPYTSTGYFSGGNGEGPAGMNPSSWHTARNFADVVTNSWYMLRTWSGNVNPSTLFRVDDVGRSLTDLYDAIGNRVTDVALARDKGRVTVFIRTADNALSMSTDTCRTFQPIMSKGVHAKFSNTHIAVDPNHSDSIYLGQNNGKVWRFYVHDGTFEPVGTGLPNINCSRLLFHEGSGDLYFVDYNSGIYILRNGETQWKFWTRGYNPGKFNDCDINYTTQEFVLSDYGRGVWVADLETPSDRYFKDGFTLKELSHRNGRRTFGINTHWTIPLYYNYQWKVDGHDIDNPYQYLVLDDSKGAKDVQLILTLREAPDVKTTSEVYSIVPTESVPIERRQGNALYSTGTGRVDLGYMDWFYDDFTVDLWLKPQGDGVILSNCYKSPDKAAKGWLLYIEGGILKFNYTPANYLHLPTYEEAYTQRFTINGSAIPSGKWSHVAVTHKQNGNICLYLNGQLVGSGARELKELNGTRLSLNNAVCLSLFGDAFENNCLQGSVDEVKVWNKSLSMDELRAEMFSVNLSGCENLVAYYGFNGDGLQGSLETFTGYQPLSRTRAVTSAQRMTVPVSADFVSGKQLEGATDFSSGNIRLVKINAGGQTGVKAFVFGYDSNRWNDPDDNLSEEYYQPTDYGYMIRTFGDIPADAQADISFYNGEGSFDAGTNYRIYAADNSDDRLYWKQVNSQLIHENDGSLKLSGIRLSDIVDRKLLVVSMKPAIEVTVEGLSPDGRIVLYDEDAGLRFPFTATLIEGKKLTDNRYEIMSDSAVLIVPERPLTFDANHQAKGEIMVDKNLIGNFRNTISTYLRGKNDSDMIPIPVDILNRITPESLYNCVEITNGGLRFGSAADFAPIKGSDRLTIMGWIRIDNETTITSGRNGDGVAPLMFFRSATGGNTATGIHLRKGNVGYHWNDNSTTYNATSNFTITKDDLGKWIHLALVVEPNGAYIYYNGMKQKMNSPASMGGCNAESPLLLGLNIQGGNTYFSGAFDHVALWNRSLSDDEIRKYMHNRVLLNDPGLVSYITMDDFDDAGRFVDSSRDVPVSAQFGTVRRGIATPVPFAPIRTTNNLSEGSIRINGASGIVCAFEGRPYNYINAGAEVQNYLPFNAEYYTVTFATKPSGSAPVAMTFNNAGLVDGEEIAVAIRDLGSTQPFTTYVKAESVAGQQARFSIPASSLSETSEMMIFSLPNDVHRPNIVEMSFADKNISSGDTYILRSGVNTIDVNVYVPSGSGAATLAVTEPYVSINGKSEYEINLSDAEQSLTLTIDKNALRQSNPFGLNDVTLNVSGAQSETLSLKVGLEPRVKLKLNNGTDAYNYLASSPVSTLEIEAELEEGYLDRDVELKVSPDTWKTSFNISNGKLLLNENVNIASLDFHPDHESGFDNGWNLVGNPYLVNINITKEQNIVRDNVTRYVYHTLPHTDNLIAFDMTDYDAEQSIAPFGSYFVQTMSPEASITITPVAKERELSRKTFDYYAANEIKTLKLSLVDADGNEIDRTSVRWHDGADQNFVINEDAPKMPSLNGDVPNLYSLTNDGKAVSINYVPESENTVGLRVANGAAANLTLRITEKSGFSNIDKVEFVDGSYDTLINAGDVFSVNNPDDLAVTYVRDGLSDITDADSLNHAYGVYTGIGTCTVTGLQGDAEISIYDMSGIRLVGVHTSQPSFTTDIKSGAYLVRILENNREFATKIIVR